MKIKMPYDDYVMSETKLNCFHQDHLDIEYLLDAYRERIFHELQLLKENNKSN